MGIGRREFLKLTSLALAGLAIDPLQAVAINQNAYINKKLGLLFQKPEGWHFFNVKNFAPIKEGLVFANGWNDRREMVLEELDDPICTMTKYDIELPENKDVVTPCINVNVSHRSEYEDVGSPTFHELRRSSELMTTQLLRDYKVIRRYDPYNCNGCTFYEYDATYLFEHTELPEPRKMELKVIKAEHNDFYYDFNYHQSATNG